MQVSSLLREHFRHILEYKKGYCEHHLRSIEGDASGPSVSAESSMQLRDSAKGSEGKNTSNERQVTRYKMDINGSAFCVYLLF